MSMRRIRRAVATGGEYVAKDNSTKKRYYNVGTLFKRDDDTLTLKLDQMPIDPEFNGWINFYEIDEKDSKPAAAKPAPAPEPEFDDDIPF